MLSRIINIGKIVSWSPNVGKLISLENQEILIEDGIIKEIGTNVSGAEVEFDAKGALITPGFVDSHTHPIFFGNRGSEFGMRVAGKTYEEIAKAGGGIISSITGVRNANEDELFDYCEDHINYFLDHGTTTIEAKSGYGLTLEDELKSLRVIKRLNEKTDLDYNIGYAYFKKNEYDRAIEYFKRYAENSQHDAAKRNDAYLRLGDSYFVNSQYWPAMESYNAAIANGVWDYGLI